MFIVNVSFQPYSQRKLGGKKDLMHSITSKDIKKTTFGPRQLKACQYCYDKKIKCIRSKLNDKCQQCLKLHQNCINRTPVKHIILNEKHFEYHNNNDKYKFSLNSIESLKSNNNHQIVNISQIFDKICEIITNIKSEVAPISININDFIKPNYNAKLIDHSVIKNIKHSNILKFDIMPPKIISLELLNSCSEIISYDYQVMNKNEIEKFLNFIYYQNDNIIIENSEMRNNIVKTLLVLSLGRLHDIKVEHVRENYPGIELFKHALELNVNDYEDISLSYIENLVLISLYLITLNAINSTNIYISIAIKCVLIKGLHLESTYDNIKISDIERERMRRLWCTVFNIDAFNSSLIGCTSMISENLFNQKLLPTDNLNDYFNTRYFITERIKLTCIRKDIIRLINTDFVNDEDFVSLEKEVLNDLKSRLDSVLLKASVKSSLTGKRSLLAIALRLNECISLATFLFLLKLWTNNMRKFLNLNVIEFTPAIMEGYIKLSKVCINAAISNLNIICSLNESNDLSSFGFIDTNFLFFSSIIIFLARNLSNITDFNVDELYQKCISILQEFTKMGGVMANEYVNKLTALEEFTNQLGLHTFNYYPNFDQLSNVFGHSEIFLEFFENVEEFDFNKLDIFK